LVGLHGSRSFYTHGYRFTLRFTFFSYTVGCWLVPGLRLRCYTHTHTLHLRFTTHTHGSRLPPRGCYTHLVRLLRWLRLRGCVYGSAFWLPVAFTHAVGLRTLHTRWLHGCAHRTRTHAHTHGLHTFTVGYGYAVHTVTLRYAHRTRFTTTHVTWLLHAVAVLHHATLHGLRLKHIYARVRVTRFAVLGCGCHAPAPHTRTPRAAHAHTHACARTHTRTARARTHTLHRTFRTRTPRCIALRTRTRILHHTHAVARALRGCATHVRTFWCRFTFTVTGYTRTRCLVAHTGWLRTLVTHAFALGCYGSHTRTRTHAHAHTHTHHTAVAVPLRLHARLRFRLRYTHVLPVGLLHIRFYTWLRSPFTVTHGSVVCYTFYTRYGCARLRFTAFTHGYVLYYAVTVTFRFGYTRLHTLPLHFTHLVYTLHLHFTHVLHGLRLTLPGYTFATVTVCYAPHFHTFYTHVRGYTVGYAFTPRLRLRLRFGSRTRTALPRLHTVVAGYGLRFTFGSTLHRFYVGFTLHVGYGLLRLPVTVARFAHLHFLYAFWFGSRYTVTRWLVTLHGFTHAVTARLVHAHTGLRCGCGYRILPVVRSYVGCRLYTVGLRLPGLRFVHGYVYVYTRLFAFTRLRCGCTRTHFTHTHTHTRLDCGYFTVVARLQLVDSRLVTRGYVTVVGYTVARLRLRYTLGWLVRLRLRFTFAATRLHGYIYTHYHGYTHVHHTVRTVHTHTVGYVYAVTVTVYTTHTPVTLLVGWHAFGCGYTHTHLRLPRFAVPAFTHTALRLHVTHTRVYTVTLRTHGLHGYVYGWVCTRLVLFTFGLVPGLRVTPVSVRLHVTVVYGCLHTHTRTFGYGLRLHTHTVTFTVAVTVYGLRTRTVYGYTLRLVGLPHTYGWFVRLHVHAVTLVAVTFVGWLRLRLFTLLPPVACYHGWLHTRLVVYVTRLRFTHTHIRTHARTLPLRSTHVTVVGWLVPAFTVVYGSRLHGLHTHILGLRLRFTVTVYRLHTLHTRLLHTVYVLFGCWMGLHVPRLRLRGFVTTSLVPTFYGCRLLRLVHVHTPTHTRFAVGYGWLHHTLPHTHGYGWLRLHGYVHILRYTLAVHGLRLRLRYGCGWLPVTHSLILRLHTFTLVCPLHTFTRLRYYGYVTFTLVTGYVYGCLPRLVTTFGWLHGYVCYVCLVHTFTVYVTVVALRLVYTHVFTHVTRYARLRYTVATFTLVVATFGCLRLRCLVVRLRYRLRYGYILHYVTFTVGCYVTLTRLRCVYGWIPLPVTVCWTTVYTFVTLRLRLHVLSFTFTVAVACGPRFTVTFTRFVCYRTRLRFTVPHTRSAHTTRFSSIGYGYLHLRWVGLVRITGYGYLRLQLFTRSRLPVCVWTCTHTHAPAHYVYRILVTFIHVRVTVARLRFAVCVYAHTAHVWFGIRVTHALHTRTHTHALPHCHHAHTHTHATTPLHTLRFWFWFCVYGCYLGCRTLRFWVLQFWVLRGLVTRIRRYGCTGSRAGFWLIWLRLVTHAHHTRTAHTTAHAHTTRTHHAPHARTHAPHAHRTRAHARLYCTHIRTHAARVLVARAPHHAHTHALHAPYITHVHVYVTVGLRLRVYFTFTHVYGSRLRSRFTFHTTRWLLVRTVGWVTFTPHTHTHLSVRFVTRLHTHGYVYVVTRCWLRCIHFTFTLRLLYTRLRYSHVYGCPRLHTRSGYTYTRWTFLRCVYVYVCGCRLVPHVGYTRSVATLRLRWILPRTHHTVARSVRWISFLHVYAHTTRVTLHVTHTFYVLRLRLHIRLPFTLRLLHVPRSLRLRLRFTVGCSHICSYTPVTTLRLATLGCTHAVTLRLRSFALQFLPYQFAFTVGLRLVGLRSRWLVARLHTPPPPPTTLRLHTRLHTRAAYTRGYTRTRWFTVCVCYVTLRLVVTLVDSVTFTLVGYVYGCTFTPRLHVYTRTHTTPVPRWLPLPLRSLPVWLLRSPHGFCYVTFSCYG